ncbi:hypothetical protein HK102_004649 [Quaeritorhiza haematococci]|nr:hypothetical protein HK102_004649 [Quaeritorhiza haematococci]
MLVPLVRCFMIPLLTQLCARVENWSVCGDVVMRVFNGRLGIVETDRFKAGVDGVGGQGMDPVIYCIMKWLIATACTRSPLYPKGTGPASRQGDVIDPAAKLRKEFKGIAGGNADTAKMQKDNAVAVVGKLPTPEAMRNVRMFCVKMLGVLPNRSHQVILCLLSLFDDPSYVFRLAVARAAAIRTLNYDETSAGCTSIDVLSAHRGLNNPNHFKPEFESESVKPVTLVFRPTDLAAPQTVDSKEAFCGGGHSDAGWTGGRRWWIFHSEDGECSIKCADDESCFVGRMGEGLGKFGDVDAVKSVLQGREGSVKAPFRFVLQCLDEGGPMGGCPLLSSTTTDPSFGPKPANAESTGGVVRGNVSTITGNARYKVVGRFAADLLVRLTGAQRRALSDTSTTSSQATHKGHGEGFQMGGLMAEGRRDVAPDTATDPTWTLRQCIAFVVAGVLEGSATSSVVSLVATSLSERQQKQQGNMATPSANAGAPICDSKVLRLCAPVLYRLRKDSSWTIRVMCLEACGRCIGVYRRRDESGNKGLKGVFGLGFQSRVEEQVHDDEESLTILYRIVRGEVPFDEPPSDTAKTNATYNIPGSFGVGYSNTDLDSHYDTLDAHPQVRTLIEAIVAYGRENHLRVMYTHAPKMNGATRKGVVALGMNGRSGVTSGIGLGLGRVDRESTKVRLEQEDRRRARTRAKVRLDADGSKRENGTGSFADSRTSRAQWWHGLEESIGAGVGSQNEKVVLSAGGDNAKPLSGASNAEHVDHAVSSTYGLGVKGGLQYGTLSNSGTSGTYVNGITSTGSKPGNGKFVPNRASLPTFQAVALSASIHMPLSNPNAREQRNHIQPTKGIPTSTTATSLTTSQLPTNRISPERTALEPRDRYLLRRSASPDEARIIQSLYSHLRDDAAADGNTHGVEEMSTSEIGGRMMDKYQSGVVEVESRTKGRTWGSDIAGLGGDHPERAAASWVATTTRRENRPDMMMSARKTTAVMGASAPLPNTHAKKADIGEGVASLPNIRNGDYRTEITASSDVVTNAKATKSSTFRTFEQQNVFAGTEKFLDEAFQQIVDTAFHDVDGGSGRERPIVNKSGRRETSLGFSTHDTKTNHRVSNNAAEGFTGTLSTGIAIASNSHLPPPTSTSPLRKSDRTAAIDDLPNISVLDELMSEHLKNIQELENVTARMFRSTNKLSKLTGSVHGSKRMREGKKSGEGKGKKKGSHGSLEHLEERKSGVVADASKWNTVPGGTDGVHASLEPTTPWRPVVTGFFPDDLDLIPNSERVAADTPVGAGSQIMGESVQLQHKKEHVNVISGTLGGGGLVADYQSSGEVSRTSDKDHKDSAAKLVGTNTSTGMKQEQYDSLFNVSRNDEHGYSGHHHSHHDRTDPHGSSPHTAKGPTSQPVTSTEKKPQPQPRGAHEPDPSMMDEGAMSLEELMLDDEGNFWKKDGDEGGAGSEHRVNLTALMMPGGGGICVGIMGFGGFGGVGRRSAHGDGVDDGPAGVGEAGGVHQDSLYMGIIGESTRDRADNSDAKNESGDGGVKGFDSLLLGESVLGRIPSSSMFGLGPPPGTRSGHRKNETGVGVEGDSEAEVRLPLFPPEVLMASGLGGRSNLIEGLKRGANHRVENGGHLEVGEEDEEEELKLVPLRKLRRRQERLSSAKPSHVEDEKKRDGQSGSPALQEPKLDSDKSIHAGMDSFHIGPGGMDGAFDGKGSLGSSIAARSSMASINISLRTGHDGGDADIGGGERGETVEAHDRVLDQSSMERVIVGEGTSFGWREGETVPSKGKLKSTVESKSQSSVPVGQSQQPQQQEHQQQPQQQHPLHTQSLQRPTEGLGSFSLPSLPSNLSLYFHNSIFNATVGAASGVGANAGGVGGGGGPSFVLRTRLRGVIDMLLKRLVFGSVQKTEVDYARVVGDDSESSDEEGERQSKGSGDERTEDAKGESTVVKEVLHPILWSVFRLDPTLVFELCGAGLVITMRRHGLGEKNHAMKW